MSETTVQFEGAKLFVNPDQVVRITVASKQDYSKTKYEEVKHRFLLFLTWSEKVAVGMDECFKWVNTVEYSNRRYDSWTFDTEDEALKHGETLVGLIDTVH